MATLHDLVDRIAEGGVLTTEEYDSIFDVISRDGRIDEEESREISRIFRLVSEQKVTIVDPERERSERLKRMEGFDRADYGF